jgi:hypothetical protein
LLSLRSFPDKHLYTLDHTHLIVTLDNHMSIILNPIMPYCEANKLWVYICEAGREIDKLARSILNPFYLCLICNI